MTTSSVEQYFKQTDKILEEINADIAKNIEVYTQRLEYSAYECRTLNNQINKKCRHVNNMVNAGLKLKLAALANERQTQYQNLAIFKSRLASYCKPYKFQNLGPADGTDVNADIGGGSQGISTSGGTIEEQLTALHHKCTKIGQEAQKLAQYFPPFTVDPELYSPDREDEQNKPSKDPNKPEPDKPNTLPNPITR